MNILALSNDVAALAPVFMLGGAAMAVLLMGLVVRKEQGAGLGLLSLVGLALAAVLLYYYVPWGSNRSAFGQMVAIDNFYLFFSALAIGVTALAVVLSLSYVDRTGLAPAEYYALLAFAASGMVVMVAATNLILLLVGLELLSLSLYVLAGFARTRLTSEEAALKYFLLGSFALGLLIYGSALVYGVTASLDYSAIAKALQGQKELSPMLLVGFGLVLVGFGFKLSFVPFHMWAPDVYEGAPTPVTAFMAVGTKVVMFAALLRLLATAFPATQTESAAILAALAALTMIVGNVAAVVQSNIKRLLAYSAIAHAGYILMALVAGGSSAVLFYLLAYTVMNFGAFAVIVAVGEGREEKLNLEDYVGLGRRNPWLAALMTLFLLGLAGVPPTVGFLAKLYVFSAAVQGGYLWLAAIGIATSIVAVYYYLKVVVAMYMVEPASERLPARPAFSTAVVLVVAAFFTLQMGILPGLLLNVAQFPALAAF